MHRRFNFLFLLVIAAPAAFAQVVPVASVVPPERQSFYSRIRGLFDFNLPNIDPPGTIKLVLYPHVSDLLRRDYLRVDTGFRWAVSHRLEINPEAAAYFSHGIRHGGSGAGIGEFRLGTKSILPEWPNPAMKTSLTLDLQFPTGNPPVDLTDGLNHVAPGFLVEHHSRRYEKLTTFCGAGLDLVTTSHITGTPSRNTPRDSSMNFTAGAIYDLGQFKYTLSTTYASTALIGNTTQNFFYLRPSVLWYVPRKYTFNSKTRWIVGLGARVSWGPDGNEISVSNRLRAEITFRQVMEKMRLYRPIGPDDNPP